MKRTRRLDVFVAASSILFLSASRSFGAPVPSGIELREGLALPVPKDYAEIVIAPNPVEADLALGTWKAPLPGEKVSWPGGASTVWRTVAAGADGWFSDSVLAGCYIRFAVNVKRRMVMILQAKGNEFVYVNGAPRAGNPYCLKDVRASWEPDFDYSRLPVLLEKGRNELVFRCARGAFKAHLYTPPAPVFFNESDLTVPDLVAGRPADTFGSIVVVNATREPLTDLVVRASVDGAPESAADVPRIEKLTVRKVAFPIVAAAPREPGSVAVALGLYRRRGGELERVAAASLALRVCEPGENRRETFMSAIDGSVQYYAINPAREQAGERGVGSDAADPAETATETRGRRPALVLSLHGASVEAVNQSGSYGSKSWAHVVAPTNRRPYGFNWEEWGRLDAFEVLDVVARRYAVDEDRIYLTGHSMGGHGTWHLATLFPDRFAAAGPSAGWVSFWTYRFRGRGEADTSAVRRMIRRATAPSETFRHAANLRQLGLYVLHGADDDNVPATESRSMVDTLRAFHEDFVYHEEPGAGHWWDRSEEPGADCVDWPPLFDFFARHARPGRDRIRNIRFVTSNPGVSGRNNWLLIDAQITQHTPSTVDIRFDPGLNRFTGTTENISRLALDADLARGRAPVTVELDGQTLVFNDGDAQKGRFWLWLVNGRWSCGGEPWPEHKGSHRYGTFKEAWRNRPVLVYGTKGTREENAWAYGRARFDAEKLWYQGNGSVTVISDVDFDAGADEDRSVILYGNAKTNAAWKRLLGGSPVQVRPGAVLVGDRVMRGRDMGCIFVRPRDGSKTACVAAVSGTGAAGMRLGNRIPYLNPGIGLPDCTVFDSRTLTSGDAGVLLTGFFGPDWGVGGGDWASSRPRE